MVLSSIPLCLVCRSRKIRYGVLVCLSFRPRGGIRELISLPQTHKSRGTWRRWWWWWWRGGGYFIYVCVCLDGIESHLWGPCRRHREQTCTEYVMYTALGGQSNAQHGRASSNVIQSLHIRPSDVIDIHDLYRSNHPSVVFLDENTHPYTHSRRTTQVVSIYYRHIDFRYLSSSAWDRSDSKSTVAFSFQRPDIYIYIWSPTPIRRWCELVETMLHTDMIYDVCCRDSSWTAWQTTKSI